uniref:Anaphase-promoting complex subunit 4 WD40 domain-containing protein n=1 Tax=Aureoumbra lagunensis TaxID=44058 RepID=A0A7S3K3B9_9STRA|mmetsp:Transcript_3358/g.4681  ORF Transcript_3358/g.4681 Transcript_3358/m.4681 type:complete len:536 (+) Transcript_3358:36-1643(+)
MSTSLAELQTRAPIFGLICIKKDNEWLALYCGGGGSSKTGVGNQIAVVRIEEDKLIPEGSMDTGSELGAAMCLLGKDGLIVCFGRKFRGLTLKSKSEILPRFNDVQGDFHETDPCLNGCDVDKQMLATGGDDCKLRLWHFDNETCLQAPMLYKECPGHTAAISDTRFANAGHLVCTSSKDGSCRIWSAASGSCLTICDAKTVTPSSILNAKPKNKRNRRPAPPFKLICRAARFSDDDHCLIALASGSRGAAFAAKWRLVPSSFEEKTVSSNGKQTSHQQNDQGTILPDSNSALLTSKINHVRIVSANPISAVAENGVALALGSVSGQITFADQADLVQLKQTNIKQHDLPITACSFAGDHADIVLTASADYKIIAHKLPTKRIDPSGNGRCCLLTFLALLCFISAAVSAFFVFDLTAHTSFFLSSSSIIAANDNSIDHFASSSQEEYALLHENAPIQHQNSQQEEDIHTMQEEVSATSLHQDDDSPIEEDESTSIAPAAEEEKESALVQEEEQLSKNDVLLEVDDSIVQPRHDEL